MGQNSSSQAYNSVNFSVLREVPNGSIVREESTNKLHFIKQYSFTSQQAYQQAFINYSKKLPEKHEHIFFLERTTTKVENTFCSTFYKIALVYEYIDHTLNDQIRQRTRDHKLFEEKEVWSVLCSCTLAVAAMIRMEGHCHSALRAKDIRLTKEGVVKILSLEMIGMDSDQDSNSEGTTKMLAMTILHCLLLQEITNKSNEYLEECIESTDFTGQMKNTLHLMINDSTTFIELEEYLFRLVQEDNDSLASYSNTPLLQERARSKHNYSNIKEESKEYDGVDPLLVDAEDLPVMIVRVVDTEERETPDQNDLLEESQQKSHSDSNSNTLREKNRNVEPEKIQKRKAEKQNFNPKVHYPQSKIIDKQNTFNMMRFHEQKTRFHEQKTESNPKMELNPKLQSIGSLRQIKKEQNFSFTVKEPSNQASFENSLFTDPKLLNLIHSDLQEIKKRKSFDGARSVSHQSSISIATQKRQIYQKKQESEESINNVTAEFVPIKQKITEQAFIKKQVPTLYENIMNNDEIGLRKAKAKAEVKQSLVIQKEKDKSYESSMQPSQRSKESSQFYGSSNCSESNPNFNFSQKNITISNRSEQDKKMAVEVQRKEPKPVAPSMKTESSQNDLEYVSQTYLRGRYQGTKLNGMRHGKGVFHYTEGGKYIGSWKENKMHGKGVLYYPNNQIAYEGDWKNDQLCGMGTLYNEEVLSLKIPFNYSNWQDVDDYWIKYEGEFLNDNKHGNGKLFLVNGEIFEGKFLNDMVTGQGILYRKDGNPLRGLWKENKIVRLF